MIRFEAGRTLAVAAAVWLIWRIFVWRRRGGDPIREVGIGAMFIWSLVVVKVTFFPLVIIFYDWFGTSNLVPFASIAQLVRETNTDTAVYNIAGNLALFVPFGLLMPLLFDRVRSARAVIWRAAVVSVTIEVIQYITQARATDVDDVILNVAGAAVGFVLFRAVHEVLALSAGARDLLDRFGSPTGREPPWGSSPPWSCGARTTPGHRPSRSS